MLRVQAQELRGQGEGGRVGRVGGPRRGAEEGVFEGAEVGDLCEVGLELGFGAWFPGCAGYAVLFVFGW